MRIEKVGGDREGFAVSKLRHLSFGEEKKVRFRGEKVVFHRLKVRAKAANVAEIKNKKIRSVKAPGVVNKGSV